jgi:signal transduction histidine kinase
VQQRAALAAGAEQTPAEQGSGQGSGAASLRAQMAIMSAGVALAAVLIVTLTTLAAVSLAFRTYQARQLDSEASRTALTLGQGHYFTDPNSVSRLATLARKRQGTTDIWIMDAAGSLLVQPDLATRQGESAQIEQDKSTVLQALTGALAQEQPSNGSLTDAFFSPIGQRLYSVAPVYLNGNPESVVVGAIAISTPPRDTQAAYAVFQSAVTRIALVSAGAAVLLAVLAALLFSRRLTRPLARLTAATARMAGGDYATRVKVRAPDELVRLASSFNEMAAALEHDVSELARQERLRRELVANVSHELATPLTAISGFTEALLDGVVHRPDEREETVRLIAREAARLRRLVDQLRQVALYEAGTKALDRAPVQVGALAEQTLDVLAPELARKQVHAANHLPPNLPSVYADADRLTEILLNLLDNALRHVPPGGRIEVAGGLEGHLVRVSIADNGPGIAPQDRGRVFDRFYRADPSRSSTTGGSGLGLAIVRSLVEAHGGTIHVDERSGGGARFSFTLPLYAGQPTRSIMRA